MEHNEYIKQIMAMAERARVWREENPGKVSLVQFNTPPGVLVIAD